MNAGIIRIALGVAFIASATSVNALTVSFTGAQHKVLEVAPDNRSGLEKVYVAYNAAEISEMLIEGTGNGLTVSRYSNLGGGYAEPVTFRWDGMTAIVDRPQGNSGYIFTENGRNTCIWLVDYSTQKMTLSGVNAASTQDCDMTQLEIQGNAPVIHYFSIDGRPIELSRDIELSYYSQVWNENGPGFEREVTHKTLSHLSNPQTIMPALNCATEVTITGDRFLDQWGMGLSVTSPTISPNGLNIQTTAVQTNLPEESEDGSNIINGTEGEGALGGSAPATILFTAYCTEGVIHDEWQISADPEFGIPEYRFNEREVEYTFEQEGTYYVRYIGSNADGTCEVYGDTYTVSIGASDLRIPNAFTPNDDGVNDVWKVAYRSLLSFKCWIFDRYGNEIYRFDDPSQGWDGKYKGKTVKSGVYFYVIEATGSDGQKYKKGGDINVVSYKRYEGANGGGGATE